MYEERLDVRRSSEILEDIPKSKNGSMYSSRFLTGEWLKKGHLKFKFACQITVRGKIIIKEAVMEHEWILTKANNCYRTLVKHANMRRSLYIGEEGSNQGMELLLKQPLCKIQVMTTLTFKSYEKLKWFFLHFFSFLFLSFHFIPFHFQFLLCSFIFFFFSVLWSGF